MKLFVIGASLLACFSFSVQAEEVFNQSTGELYWNLNEEVRLEYIPLCELNSPYDDSGNSPIHEFILNIDVFSILGYKENERFVVCKSRGLRAIYRLREDKKFPAIFFEDSISINGETIRFSYEGGYGYTYPSDSENYQPIYSAIQTKSKVVARIRDRRFSTNNASLNVPIDISNLDESDSIHKQKLDLEVDNLNAQLRQKYTYVILCDFILLISLVMAFLMYKIKIHPSVKTNIFRLANLTSTFGARRNKGTADILKKDKLSTYSVADELIKWAKLKDEGHISKEEYDKARKQILGKSD